MIRSVCIRLALVLLPALACDAGRGEPARPSPAAVSALGPSWLTRLGVTVQSTALGRTGGTAPPAVAPPREPTPNARGALPEAPFDLTGADIYRMSCRACHGPGGAGAPPQITSLVGPVQATSAALLRERTASAQSAPSEQMIAELTRQAQTAVEQRIERGGQKMPAFDYLTEPERRALWEHLRVLADVPEAKGHETRLSLSAGRVGALIVRGTCHICHDATGPGGHHPGMMMHGIVPSLEGMRAYPFWMFAEKVQRGRVQGMHGMHGMHWMMGQAAQMPALPYFTRAEIAAVYRFLRD